MTRPRKFDLLEVKHEGEPEPLILLELTEAEATSLRDGQVPDHIAETCRRALLWFEADAEGYALAYTQR